MNRSIGSLGAQPARWLRRVVKLGTRHLARVREFTRPAGLDVSLVIRPRQIMGPCPLPPLSEAQSHAVDLYLQHFFCVLGSGWTRLARTVQAESASGGGLSTRDGRAPRAREAFERRANRIRAMIGAGHQLMDWHVDFKSGYHWPASAWYEDIVVVGIPGVDVKVPWELARMQHLPLLARAVADSTCDDSERPQRCRREIRNQILDFIAHNPPRHGVNWASPMDVAIRAINWIVALEICRTNAVEFDDEFCGVLAASLREHARHVSENLEWTPEFRGNHFFASVLGILFVARYLPADVETDRWLAWAIHQLRLETQSQFNGDGSNIEASTAYHRLTAEMAILGTAIVLGLDDQCLTTVTKRVGGVSTLTGKITTRETGSTQPASALAVLGTEHFERLERMARFSVGVTKPDGKAVLIGDNDSGRVVKIDPAFAIMAVAEARRRFDNLHSYGERPDDALHLEEDLSSHADVIAGVSALCGQAVPGDGSPDAPMALLVNSLAKGRCVARPSSDEVQSASGMDDASVWARYAGIADAVGFEVRRELAIEVSGRVPEEIARTYFPDFGFFVLQARDFYLAIRCGPALSGGNGAHAHNDQLAIELQIAGKDVLTDPGSYCYTPSPELRNAYRSITAHSGPRVRNREPNSLEDGMFTLVDRSSPRCLYFGVRGFIGTHSGYGTPVHRLIAVQAGAPRIRIVDFFSDGDAARKSGLVLEEIDARVPFSPAYGVACHAH